MPRAHENSGGPSFHGLILKGWCIARGSARGSFGRPATPSDRKSQPRVSPQPCHSTGALRTAKSVAERTPVFVFASRYPEASASGLSSPLSRNGARSPRLQPRVSAGVCLSKTTLALGAAPSPCCSPAAATNPHKSPTRHPHPSRAAAHPSLRSLPPAPPRRSPSTTPPARPSTPRPDSPAGTAPTTTAVPPPTAPSTTRTA